MNVRRYILTLFAVIMSFFCAFACTEKQNDGESDDTVFTISGIVKPTPFEIRPGGAIELKFVGNNGPRSGDIAELKAEDGTLHNCGAIQITGSFLSFRVARSVTTGKYVLCVVRGEQMAETVPVQITIISSVEVNPAEGSTVYGIVECGGVGVENVTVSDGYEVVRTDKDGIYQMKSGKQHNYVFVSIPGNYEVPANGALPVLHKLLKADPATPERVDFSLVKAEGQDNHTMLFFGDLHLANRGSGSNNDMAQFGLFVNDVNDWTAANAGKKIYAMTLGDMSWDLYWVSKSYDLDDYVEDIKRLKGLQVFNTIGNHDHEMAAVGDLLTVEKYKAAVAPTYYSFNIGKVHYVVLDNIECTNDGKGSRTYNTKVVNEELEWLEKDLSYLSKDTPLVITMHAPVYKASGSYNMSNSSALVGIVSGFSNVHFVTGHTHKMYNVEKGDNIYEHNSAAVCATWWWSGKYVPGINICQDGTPGGYRIMDVVGNDMKWVYKPVGKTVDHQFRSYDRNTTHLSAGQYVPNGNSTSVSKFNTYAADWKSSSSENLVYINVWDWDSDWDISVTENGRTLQWEKVSAADPLHLVTYTAKCLNKSSDTPSFPTSATNHFFRVKASGPGTTLEIKVTDRFGRTYTETMTRPKAFSTETYK